MGLSMKSFIVLLALLGLSACNTAYKKPVESVKTYSVKVNNPATAIEGIRKSLILDGYSIESSSEAHISTSHRLSDLSVMDADCGTTMGIDYLKDSRTQEYVSVGVLVEESLITVKTNIYAEYLPGDSMHGKKMNCVSRGLLETRLLEQVK